MYTQQQSWFLYSVYAAACLFCHDATAVEFQPSAGVALEYTNNATLTQDNKVDDLITVAYVGAKVSENEGPLKYSATTSFNRHVYTQDTFADQNYFSLAADADWAMIKDRFNWTLSDFFNQRTVNSLNSNTPNNLQDSNVFTFGANIKFPVSRRQSFSLSPVFNQYYFEVLATDNKQFSLAASWNYQMFRLTNVGLNLSARKIDYTETNSSGQSIDDLRFTNLGIIIDGQRLRSKFSVNLGVTNVKRDNEEETSGFAGNLSWLIDLSSRSTFETRVSRDITDASSISANITADPDNGSGDDVQITADIIRNSIINLAYFREGASLRTRISARYHKLEYSESPLDRIVRTVGIELNYPVTQLLSSGVFINYNRTRELDTTRLDENFTVGSNLRYNFSRKLHGLFDLKYRTKDSTFAAENYNEFSVFASFVYGFGDVQRPTRAGGF